MSYVAAKTVCEFKDDSHAVSAPTHNTGPKFDFSAVFAQYVCSRLVYISNALVRFHVLPQFID